MQITLFSLFMSVVWSSVLVVFNYFCRKKHFFIRQLGITNVLFLYLFSIVRMLVPYEFSFTRVIHSKGPVSSLCTNAYINDAGTMQVPVLTVFTIVWAAGSAVLLVRFICQYRKAMKTFSGYDVCKEEQCRRIFQRISGETKYRMKINIRCSDDIMIPMGVGLLHKSIILPEKVYSDSELYHILRHEYTHFQNRDLILKMLGYIYWCIFWWNPAVYLLKRDLAQILEIKCDLDVTKDMEHKEKAEYLTTIVTVMKNARAGRRQKAFYGTAALVFQNCESELVERFKIVSGSSGLKRENFVFTGAWFLMIGILVFASYSFVIHPDYETPKEETAAVSGKSNGISGSYQIERVNDKYYVHFNDK